MTELDDTIRRSLERLRNPEPLQPFDPQAYIVAFRPSAQRKAQEVISLLSSPKTSPFVGQKPVFVNIGGGDAEELAYLLGHTEATHGVLLEPSRALANLARARQVPGGQSIEVIEGFAQDRTAQAIDHAHGLVHAGLGDFIAVTCHAVIHELPDRGDQGFKPVEFFSDIYRHAGDDIWFTYREPGVPEKWPDTVLLGADCSPSSLLELASVIAQHHQELRELHPKPKVTGDHVYIHRALAMETIVKVFYLDDLPYEIQERSTSVNHSRLISDLSLAIGNKARRATRANILTESSATTSFCTFWSAHGIEVLGVTPGNGFSYLPVPESQTRVISWRLHATEDAKLGVQPGAPVKHTADNYQPASRCDGSADRLVSYLE
jgi:hypothetical protein